MHGVAPLKPGCHMAGPAYTLRYIPARADLDERTDMPHGGIACASAPRRRSPPEHVIIAELPVPAGQSIDWR
jgi:hypothetical protein